MKRDMDLCRAILLRSQEKTDAKPSRDTVFEGYDPEIVGYNIYLLSQAGLLDDGNQSLTNANSYRHWMIGNLTWEGNEFIDAAAKENIWERTKTYVSSKGLEMTFDIAKEALAIVTTKMLTGE